MIDFYDTMQHLCNRFNDNLLIMIKNELYIGNSDKVADNLAEFQQTMDNKMLLKILDLMEIEIKKIKNKAFL